MSVAEKTRLYQAALEERRTVYDRSDELIPSEAIEAQEHIEAELVRAWGELQVAWLTRSMELS